MTAAASAQRQILFGFSLFSQTAQKAIIFRERERVKAQSESVNELERSSQDSNLRLSTGPIAQTGVCAWLATEP